jgi:hypothetical protein
MINKGWAAIGKCLGFHINRIDGAFLHTEIAGFTIISDPALGALATYHFNKTEGCPQHLV